DQPYDQADEPYDWANDAADDWSTTRSPTSFADPQDVAATQIRPPAGPASPPVDQRETATLRPVGPEPVPAQPMAAPQPVPERAWQPPAAYDGAPVAYDETRVDDGAAYPPGQPVAADQQPATVGAGKPPVRDRV